MYLTKRINKLYYIQCEECGAIMEIADFQIKYNENEKSCKPTTIIRCRCGNETKNTIYMRDENTPEPKIRCPKCKSDSIQLVPRKWSPMTGFFTNKVDRVCMNCKHKF